MGTENKIGFPGQFAQHGDSIHSPVPVTVDLKKKQKRTWTQKMWSWAFVDSGQLAGFKLVDNENIKRRVTITDVAQLLTTIAPMAGFSVLILSFSLFILCRETKKVLKSKDV